MPSTHRPRAATIARPCNRAPPTPEWGSMLSNARNFLTLGWWAAVFPGLAITLFVISTTVLGRRLQARLEGRG